MNDVKNRISEFVKYKNVSRRQFLITCGFSESYFNNISKGISYEAIEKIKKAYPELNMPWLILGEGEMLKISSAEVQLSDEKEKEYKGTIKELETEIIALKAENKVLRELAGLGERKDSGSKSA
ncbi:hypothetical protein [Bacteroides reticulotermitis]|uniref:hypothetical protein n=1 Tax=Bacteroides reticulotermitis TaxID=1133319 RepID=UPI003A8A5425